jgi:hypothetical protein
MIYIFYIIVYNFVLISVYTDSFANDELSHIII